MDREAGRPGAFVLSDEDLNALANAMRRAGVHLLEVEGPGQRLRMKLEPSDDAPSASDDVVAAGEPSSLVKAESMGHFRAAHPDGLFPACAVDATVERAQILGFVQVGLLLLPVATPRAGRLARVLVGDGSLVGYGTPLFEIDHGLPMEVRS